MFKMRRRRNCLMPYLY